MKNLTFLLLSILFLFSCNTDDDNPGPATQPVVANAKVKFAGDCTLEHYFVELYDPDGSIIPATDLNSDFFTFYTFPQEFQIDDLEIYIEYRNLEPQEIPICNTFGMSRHPLHPLLVELPTIE